MLSDKIEKELAKEINHLFNDLQENREDRKRIVKSIAEGKKSMEEKEFRLILQK
jgi:hypothetical protein